MITQILILTFALLLTLTLYSYLKKFEKRRKSLADKVALVTGSANGLGRALCLAFAREKCHIICVDIDQNGNKETVKRIKEISSSVRVLDYTTDITNTDQINELAKDVFCKFETGVDILVNNAGIVSYNPILNQDLSIISKTINVNLISHFSTIHAFLPKMLEKNSGHIVCVSSMAAHIPVEGYVPYCASKFGQIGLMEALSLELRLAKSKVKTLTVFPGVMGTQLVPELVRKPGVYWRKNLPIVVLNVNDVAQDIINAIKEEKRFYYTQIDYHIVFYLRRLLPLFITDWFEEKFFIGAINN